jgi:hypothetical protein
MPPDAGLDTVMLVNSGSEANDMAWRIATAADRLARRDRDGARLSRGDRAIADLLARGVAAGYRPANVARVSVPISSSTPTSTTSRGDVSWTAA